MARDIAFLDNLISKNYIKTAPDVITFTVKQAKELATKYLDEEERRVFRHRSCGNGVEALIGGSWFVCQILDEEDYKIYLDYIERFGRCIGEIKLNRLR